MDISVFNRTITANEFKKITDYIETRTGYDKQINLDMLYFIVQNGTSVLSMKYNDELDKAEYHLNLISKDPEHVEQVSRLLKLIKQYGRNKPKIRMVMYKA